MDYLLISFITLLGTLIIYSIVQKAKKSTQSISVKVSQSRTYGLLAPYILPMNYRRNTNRQSFNHLEKTLIKILFINDKAYWIKDNMVYVASTKNGIILEESTKTVDMMGMNEVELEEMVFIIDKLTEGKANDYRNSRDS